MLWLSWLLQDRPAAWSSLHTSQLVQSNDRVRLQRAHCKRRSASDNHSRFCAMGVAVMATPCTSTSTLAIDFITVVTIALAVTGAAVVAAVVLLVI